MKLVDYREDLLKRLADPEWAAEYLTQTLADADGDNAAFLIALKDVVDAGGGIGNSPDESALKGQVSTRFSRRAGILR